MKQYTKPLRITRLENHSIESVTSKKFGKTAERAPAGGLSIGTLTNTQILTDEQDSFLDNCFNEWEKWLISQELRLAQLATKYHSHFTPTVFPETDSD